MQSDIDNLLNFINFRFQDLSKSLPTTVVQQFHYSTHGYYLWGARRLCVTVTPRVWDDMNFMVLPVIYQVKKKLNYITGISFALRGVNFSHQTHAVGLGFVEKEILIILIIVHCL